uniref:Citrate synthase-lysine N-methyltransferase CSKMT, mitochondrial n=1 Tax=Geotrypetes seraphini TaxID=260995 RepID=A0A6P8S831_GEOSA|nr:citrate synthase-lysine N-methyltransferase CSKMT, mitochondrial [Geotrypetes seraphini]
MILPSKWLLRAITTRLRGYCTLADDLRQRLHHRSTWDRFFKEKTLDGFHHFDCFFSYKFISGFLQSFSSRSGALEPWQVLDVGCGISDLGPSLYINFPDPVYVSCVDFSPVVIECMQQQFLDGPLPRNPLSKLHYREADATDLHMFSTESFHLVLDKGTSDSMLHSPVGLRNASRMLAECLRVLKPGGSLLQFSDEDPDARLPFLEQASGKSVTMKELGNVCGICYYSYIITLNQ